MLSNKKLGRVLQSTVKLCALSIFVFLPINGVFGFDPAAGDFAKPSPDVVRILTWNVHNNFIYNTSKDGIYQRIIKAVTPDIIAFQEMDHSLTEAQIAARLVVYFPGTTWYVHRGKADGSVNGTSNRNVIASRFPLSRTRVDTNPASDIRGVCIAMADLPDATYSKDLYLMNIHFKAGGTVTDHTKRQEHADAIINWMRDARTPGENINIPTGTPMIVTGDFNLNQNGDRLPYHASKTMLEGVIFDHSRFGPSSPPDWDGTNSTDASPYDYNTGMPWTHGSADPRGRIDRFFYTDSVLHHTSGFVLNTRTMTPAARSAAGGLLENDTSGASDHLPIICDFALGSNPAPPGRLLVNEYCANDLGADDRSFLEIKNVGGQEINLNGPVDFWLKRGEQMPATPPATENEQQAFDLAGVVPPGGFFVIYDGADESSAIKTLIETNLPPLQRQDDPGFILDNSDNSAFALVEQGRSDLNVSFETNVEAYGYAAPSPDTTRYFRTSSGNGLTITLQAKQWNDFNAGAAGIDQSMSRNPGNVDINTYEGWSIGTPLTPGQENPAPSTVNQWSLY